MDWRKIAQDLLSKANHENTSKEESDAYQEKAMYIMAKYGIDEAMLRQKTNSTEKPKFRIYKQFPPYAHTKVALLAQIASLMGGSLVRSGKDLYVFGYESDLDKIQMLYFSLLAQMHNEAAELRVPNSVSKRSYTDSWLKGYVFGVGQKLLSAYKKATGNGKELVLVRDVQVKQAMQEMFSDLKYGSCMSAPKDLTGFSSGVMSGQQADIGQDRLSKTAGQRGIGNRP